MSWSVTIIGKPEKLVQELDSYSGTLTGQSKEEFDEAKPHLQGLISQSVGENLVKLTASGHATITDGKKTFGSISVVLETFYAKLLI